jgi:hypothetical protein
MSDLEELRKENDRLKQELDAIELHKAKKEQEDLKAKLEAQKKVELEEHDKQLIAKVKAELGIGVQSKTPDTPQTAINQGRTGFEVYKEGWVKRNQARGRNIKGRSYTELLEDMQQERAYQ